MYYGKTKIILCEDKYDLGVKAASAVAATMRELLAQKIEIRMIFAAGESQMTFLDALSHEPKIEWNRIICFNMDDFWDIRMPEECTCGYQTRIQLYDKVQPKSYYLVKYNASDPYEEAHRFGELIQKAGQVDILCQGIGTSGHLALNEPNQTDFNDSVWARVVDIAEQSKNQLMEDPNFRALGYIPEKGITLTIPAMFSATYIFTMVPLRLKRKILTRVFAIENPTTNLPATILRINKGALFVDRNSCPVSILKEFDGV